MNKTKTTFYLLLTLVLLAVTACRAGSEQNPTATEAGAEAVKTAAAQTAEAALTAQAATLAAPTATETQVPASDTPSAPTATLTPALTATQTPVPNAGGQDRAQFVADVTVPDGTDFKAGEAFTKTWRLLNAGSSTWTTEYALVFVSGAQMGGAASVPLPQNVAPGDTVDVSVDLTAPQENGLQRGFWMLQNAAGGNFGIGPGFDLAFYVEINVTGGSEDGGDGGDGDATPTATPVDDGGGEGDAVAGVTVSVDETSFTGACPHTFTFNVQVATTRATRISLEIEAGAEDPSYQYNLPGPQSFDVGQGTFNYTYTLDLSSSVNGWVRVRVTEPNPVTSNQASFSLVCQ